MPSFGERIRAERERLGWTRSDLAREANVNRQGIIRVEEDPDAYMSVETALRIARAMRVSLDHLAGTWEHEEPTEAEKIKRENAPAKA